MSNTSKVFSLPWCSPVWVRLLHLVASPPETCSSQITGAEQRDKEAFLPTSVLRDTCHFLPSHMVLCPPSSSSAHTSVPCVPRNLKSGRGISSSHLAVFSNSASYTVFLQWTPTLEVSNWIVNMEDSGAPPWVWDSIFPLPEALLGAPWMFQNYYCKVCTSGQCYPHGSHFYFSMYSWAIYILLFPLSLTFFSKWLTFFLLQ